MARTLLFVSVAERRGLVNPRLPEGGWGIANQQQTEQSFWLL